MGEGERPLRVAIWCAVSSKAQAEDDKVSLPEQERMGREFAEALGGEVVDVYRVPGHTRKDYVFWAEAERDMSAYAKAREDLEARRVDVIHCADPDRLGRNAALISQFYSLAERHGAEIYTASAPHQVGQWSPSHRYLPAILAVRAAEYVGQLAHKHRQGMRGRTKRGLHPSRWPLGYQVVKDATGKTIGGEFGDDIGAVDLITRLFLEGRSYSEIAQALNKSPYTPPRGGSVWRVSTVAYVIGNDVYAGYVEWSDVQNDSPSGLFPARWSPETYAAVVRERERRRGAYPTRRSGPLRGVALCLRCGRNLNRDGGTDRVYLRCPARQGCHTNYIREDQALEDVARFLQALTTPEALDAALAAMEDKGPLQIQDLGSELARLEARAADLAEQRQRIALAFASRQMDVTMYYQTDQTLAGQEEQVLAQLRELRVDMEAQPDPEQRRANLRALVTDFPRLLAEGDAAKMSARLREAGVVVLAEDGEYGIGLWP